jgi:hemerythrin
MPFQVEQPILGIQEIDEQHGQVIACLDQLHLSVGKERGFPSMLDALNTLNAFVENHFTYEEGLLRHYGYPKLDEHIEEHRKISAELARLNQHMFDAGDVSKKLLGMVRTWINSHICVEDADFADFVGQQER